MNNFNKKDSRLTENKFLSDSEVNQLFTLLENHKGERDSIMLRLSLFTGARGIELINILKSNLGNDECITIKGRKRSNDRTIPLPKPFFNELKEYAKHFSDNQKLFPISVRRCRQIWDQYRPNKNKGLHSLRHTQGVRLYDSSRDIHLVQTVLGHKIIENTLKYLDYVESSEKIRGCMNKMWKKKVA